MALTIGHITTTDLPFSHRYGSSTCIRRRVLIALTGTCTADADTIDLSTYVPGLKQVDGAVWCSINDAGGTAGSFSWGAGSTTLTLANGAAGTLHFKIGVMGHLAGTGT
jgi:hypothetical protein